MRRAALLSVALHALAMGGLWYGLTLAPRPDEAQAEDSGVAVEIITTETVSGNAAATIESSASVQQISAGTVSATASPVEMVTPESTEPTPIAPPSLEPVVSTAQSVTDPTEPVEETEAAAPIAPTVLTATTSPEIVEAPPVIEPAPKAEVVKAASLSPIEEPPQKPKEPKPKESKPKEPKAKTPAKPKVASSGNGGTAEADTAAAAPSAKAAKATEGSGTAAVARYPGLVQRKLRKALRFPKGAGSARGEVQVRFVVAASGSVSGIEIIASSGHTVLDQEAIATVKRAAPFPPIPAEANRASWTFTMPLGFVR